MKQSTKNTIPIVSRLLGSIIHVVGIGVCSLLFSDLQKPYLLLEKRLMLDDRSMPVFIIFLVLVIITGLISLAKTGNNSFVELAGRDMINRTINNFTAISLAFFLVPLILIILSMLLPDDRQAMNMPELRSIEIEEMKTVKNMISLAFNAITSFYSIDAVISIIFTLRGYRFKNRLIYPFIRDE